MSNVLIIDDDAALGRSLQLQLEQEGHHARFATAAAAGRAVLASWSPDLILLDLKLPDGDGLEALADLKKDDPELPVAIITGRQDMKAAIEAMRRGAFDYLRKPFDLDDVLLLIEKSNRFATVARKSAMTAIGPPETGHPGEIVGADKKIGEVLKQIGLLSQSQVTVLIEGESGTGKELVARALHEAGAAGQPFVAINCSALAPSLLGSELFGHEKGAFTGADARKIGKLEHAGTGTVFLDEIGDMPLDLQAKILRVLQEREFERIGGLQGIEFKARVIAATNRDLEAMVAQGVFRQDLFFRLAVSQVRLPPLRERKGDIRLLAPYLAERIGSKLHRPVRAISEEAMRRLESYDWPGNVRELENVLTRAITLSRGQILGPDEVRVSISAPAKAPARAEETEIVPLRQAERIHVEKVLKHCDWNISRAARLLQVSPTTLRKKIEDYGLRESP